VSEITPIFNPTLPERKNYIARRQKDKSFLASAKPVRAFGLTFHTLW
jgi:hypothetical protein